MPDTRTELHILVVAPGRRPADAVERAIARLSEDQTVPHEIHVVASSDRVAELQRALLGDGGSRFAAACVAAGFSRDEILFNRRTLHSVGEHAGDCAADADRVVAILRQVAASDGAALTLVLCEDAGAAGYLLQAALQVVGKVQDRLLVDTSMPSIGKQTATSRRPDEYHHVELPLLLWPANEPAPQTYADAVKGRRTERLRIAQPDVLRLNARKRTLSVGETTITLPAMQFFWMYYLALTTDERLPLTELTNVLASGRRQPAQLTQKLPDGRVRVFPADLQRAFVQLFPMAADKFDAMYLRSCGPHPGLPCTISKINAVLRRALGRGAAPYLIQGGRGAGGYRLTLKPSGVHIAGVETRRP